MQKFVAVVFAFGGMLAGACALTLWGDWFGFAVLAVVTFAFVLGVPMMWSMK